jgi:hypothetical protein
VKKSSSATAGTCLRILMVIISNDPTEIVGGDKANLHPAAALQVRWQYLRDDVKACYSEGFNGGPMEQQHLHHDLRFDDSHIVSMRPYLAKNFFAAAQAAAAALPTAAAASIFSPSLAGSHFLQASLQALFM